MTASPLVTIAIPTYNHARVIGDAIRSALAQTYANIEILVIDNASEDETRAEVEWVVDGDSRVRYIRNEVNVGMAANFNACITAAYGEYIKFLCADDLLLPECVGAMVDAIANQSSLALVACARLLVDEQLAVLGEARFSARSVEVDGMAAIHRCFFRGNLIGEPTAVMFRRSDASRGFRHEYRQVMDLEMWMHLLQTGDLQFLDRPLCKVRQHSQQATQRHLGAGVVLEDKRRFFRQFQGGITEATFAEQLSWDIRMAVTLHRTKMAGQSTVPPEVAEIYFRSIFRWITYPVARVLWSCIDRF